VVICHSDPYKYGSEDQDCDKKSDNDSDEVICHQSEFEDANGRLYKLTQVNLLQIIGTCIHLKRNNPMFGCKKFLNCELVKLLVQ
jgi:hypothetical protein